MDEQKLALLRRWGEGLTRDAREEMRAAGRAILMLSEEIEQLHVDLWHVRDRADETSEETETPERAPWPPAPTEGGIGSALRERLLAFRLSKDE